MYEGWLYHVRLKHAWFYCCLCSGVKYYVYVYHTDRGYCSGLYCVSLFMLELSIFWFHSMVPYLAGCGLELATREFVLATLIKLWRFSWLDSMRCRGVGGFQLDLRFLCFDDNMVNSSIRPIHLVGNLPDLPHEPFVCSLISAVGCLWLLVGKIL